MAPRIHKTAEVSDKAQLGEGTSVWNNSQIREDVTIGENCNFGTGVYVDFGVTIGNNVKVQNNVSIYHGVTIGNDVFLGPHMVFTNDLRPRAKVWDDTKLGYTVVEDGASIGANATIVCGTQEKPRRIGMHSLVAAGAVVTKDVPPHGFVAGVPAKLKGFVSRSCLPLKKIEETEDSVLMESEDGEKVTLSRRDYDLVFQKAMND